MATPKGNRRKNVFGHPPRLPTTNAEDSREPEVIPRSSGPRIPSSLVCPGRVAQSVDGATTIHPSWSKLTVEQTPSRKATRVDKTSLRKTTEVNQDMDELCQASPELPVLVSRHAITRPLAPSRTPSYTLPPLLATIQCTPSQKLARTDNNLAELSVGDTPVKSREIVVSKKLVDEKLTSRQSPLNTARQQKSIYSSLGWDDNDEDELL